MKHSVFSSEADEPSRDEAPSKELESGQALPPVEPPDASFLMQLFVIPMLVVMIIVSLWLAVNWLTHSGTDPAKLVDELERPNDGSWQRAFTLANMLRNPEYEHVRDDPELAARLGDVLDRLVKEGAPSEDRVKLRVFVCRALGEFRHGSVLDPLVVAATADDASEGMAVRLAALQAIAVAVGSLPELDAEQRGEIAEPLIALTRSSLGGGDGASARDSVRATAAFTLGVVGDDASREHLAEMLHDAFPNARYNAAVGLARHGDLRATGVLAAMLDPDNPRVIEGETQAGDQTRKRLAVLTEALRSVERILVTHKLDEMPKIQAALEHLNKSEAPRDVKLAARELLQTGGG